MKICVVAWSNYRALDILNRVSNFVKITKSFKKPTKQQQQKTTYIKIVIETPVFLHQKLYQPNSWL